MKEQIAHIHRRMKAISKEKENALTKAKEHDSKVQHLKDQLLQLCDGM